MLAHFGFLVRTDADIASWHGATDQDEACCLVLGKVGIRMVVCDSAFEQQPGTGQAAALMTDRRQGESAFSRGIPDTFLSGAVERA
jgi:hypothetical protein